MVSIYEAGQNDMVRCVKDLIEIRFWFLASGNKFFNSISADNDSASCVSFRKDFLRIFYPELFYSGGGHSDLSESITNQIA